MSDVAGRLANRVQLTSDGNDMPGCLRKPWTQIGTSLFGARYGPQYSGSWERLSSSDSMLFIGLDSIGLLIKN